MTRRATSVLLAVLLLALRSPPSHSAPAPVAVCFAPGTPASYIDAVTARRAADPSLRFFAPGRWTVTATDGQVAGRGTPITLTWAIVADGTQIPGGAYDSGGRSNLRKALNGIYGSQAAWIAEFEQVFAAWGALIGVRYVHETADDGAAIGSASGVRGVRADIRIAGHPLDGDAGILAYDAFPNDGDMVLDSADAYYRNTSLDSRRLRNVVAHEHGHGLGLDHVCPLREEKLMEPSISLSFDGPQHDDILGGQRLYGDAREPDDTRPTASDLGLVGAAQVVVEDVSVNGSDDTDLYAFTADEGADADVVLSPAGRAYDHAAERSRGGCGATSQQVDSRRRADLGLAILRADGTSIATANATGIGGGESLLDVPLDRGAGRYFVRVQAADPGDVQMYRLEIRAVQRGEKPQAVADTEATWEVLPVATDVLANDTGLADRPLRLRVVRPPANGRVRIAGGRVHYIPRRGFVGDDSYTYEVSDVHRQSSAADVVVTVRPSALAGNARDDADSDGYPDEFEVLRGTAPDDGASRPGEDVAGGAAPLPLSRVVLRVSSRRPDRDQIRVRGRLPVAAEFGAAGGTVVISVAGVVREIALDARGRATGDAARTFRLHVRRRRGAIVAGETNFDLTLVRGAFAAWWTDEGLTTERRQRNEPRAATLLALFGGRTFAATVPLVWSADPGIRGAARLAR